MYTVDARSDLNKRQKIIHGWYKTIDLKLKNNIFKSLLLALIGVLSFSTGCHVEGEPAPVPVCPQELVPDTTTTDPNDSIWVNPCD